MADLSAFAKFVSPVEGHIVSRFSTLRPGAAPDMIGYTRAAIPAAEAGSRGAGVPVLNPDAIIAIPHLEWARFAREYGRALRNGALRERTAEEYLASQGEASRGESPSTTKAKTKTTT